VTISFTEQQAFKALRAFILSVLPGSVEVIQTQNNRVPQPTGNNWVGMTATSRNQLSSSYRDGDPLADAMLTARSTGLGFTLDVYGPDSTDNAQIIATLLRDEYGCRFMEPYGCQPLYCNDGNQMPLLNGEAQYEQRWMLQVMLQANPYVSTPAQFPAKVDVQFFRADE
jgi:hypothetical protein